MQNSHQETNAIGQHQQHFCSRLLNFLPADRLACKNMGSINSISGWESRLSSFVLRANGSDYSGHTPKLRALRLQQLRSAQLCRLYRRDRHLNSTNAKRPDATARHRESGAL